MWAFKALHKQTPVHFCYIPHSITQQGRVGSPELVWRQILLTA